MCVSPLLLLLLMQRRVVRVVCAPWCQPLQHQVLGLHWYPLLWGLHMYAFQAPLPPLLLLLCQ
jgi:hypothetical protein